MRVFRKYILSEFLRLFFLALSGILVVFLCVDFLQKADGLIKHKAAMSQVVRYFLYGLPAMTAQSLPAAALVSTLLTLGGLSRHNEITAMRAAGLSFARILSPLIIGGLCVSVFGFFNNESLMPRYTSRASYIKKVEIEKKQLRAVFQKSRLWLRGPDNSIANIDLISTDREAGRHEMIGVNIYKLNPDFTVRERIRAGSLLWEDGAWRLHKGVKYVRSGDRVASRPVEGEVYNIVEGPDDLGMIVKRSDELSFFELWDYVRRLKASGYNATRYEVDLHGKLAFPLSSLLMVMIASPFSLLRPRSGGAGKAFATAVLIAFVYWALMTVSLTLGKTGAVHPAAAAWAPDIAFASASLLLIKRLQGANR